MRIFTQKQNQSQKPVSSNVARSHTATPNLHYRTDLIPRLRGAMGNQAVQRMLQTQIEKLNTEMIGAASPRFGHGLGGISIQPPAAGVIQTKLKFNKPGGNLKSIPDSAPFSATVNEDAPSGSYVPVMPTLEDEDEQPEQYLPNERPEAIEPPAFSEPPASLVTPESAGPPSRAAPALRKPPALPIIAGMHRKVTSQRGPVPLNEDIFGLTMSETATANMYIDRFPTIDAFNVNGEMLHDITWDVFEGVGPRNQIDVTSEKDPAITAANYRDVAQDLRPGQGNVPPRKDYFASDLTKRHELFHVARHVRYYREGLTQGLKWLNARKARTTAEVSRLVKRMLSRIDEYGRMKTNPNLGSEENDAYEAGASDYQARSDEILRKGRAGEYP